MSGFTTEWGSLSFCFWHSNLVLQLQKKRKKIQFWPLKGDLIKHFESSCFYDLKSIHETLRFELLSIDKKRKNIFMAFKIFLFFLTVIYHIIKVSSTYNLHILQCITNIRACYYELNEHGHSQPRWSTERNIWRYAGLANLFSKGYR